VGAGLSEAGGGPPPPAPAPPDDSDLDVGLVLGPVVVCIVFCAYVIYAFARRRRMLQEVHISDETGSQSELEARLLTD